MSQGNLYDTTKEQVREAIDIVDLIGDYLRIERAGRNIKALCPWHDDTRPSLTINAQRQSFKCWVCNIGGDIFEFIMKIEGVGFPEALKMLAERAGIAYRPIRGERRPGEAPSGDEKTLLFQAMAWAERQYHEHLKTGPDSAAARSYLDSRGIKPESVARFKLGFAPERWDWLATRTRPAEVTDRILETLGLTVPRQSGGGCYDRFRGRVLFPIRDPQGRTVALGGRILPGPEADKTAKYINSPETPLFSKSKLLYGLDFARLPITKTRTALVMEGYTDCLIAQQCGFENAVAVLGTALGEPHLKLLRGMADKVVLVLDGDEAGMRRTNEILELFVGQQIDLRVLTLPEDLDPCDYLLERGAEAFSAIVETATDALEHKFVAVTRGIDPINDTHAAQQAIDDILSTLSKVRTQTGADSGAARLKESHILSRLSFKFKISEAELRRRMGELRRPARGPATPTPHVRQATSGGLVEAERALLEILIERPDLVGEVRGRLTSERLPTPICREIFGRLWELADLGIDALFERLLAEFDDHETKGLLVDLDERGRDLRRTDHLAELRGVLAVFERDRFEHEYQLQTAGAQAEQLDEGRQLDVLRYVLESQRRKGG